MVMPITSTKNFRLSSGFGVSISMWPRWARSKIGSGVMCVSPDRYLFLKLSYPRRRVSSTPCVEDKPKRRGILDHPLSRMMTAELPKRAGDVVEQLVDRERARDQFLLRAVMDDQFQRTPHLLGIETRRRRRSRGRRIKQPVHFAHRVGIGVGQL